MRFRTPRALGISLLVLAIASSAPLAVSSDELPYRFYLPFVTKSPLLLPLESHRIAFVSDRDGNSEIYVMQGDGSGQTNLTGNAAADDDPGWSPDGSQVAFGSDRDGNWDIYVMQADGSGQTNLTNNAASDRDPRWSPDGSRIAFRSDRDGNWDIYAMQADGSGQTNLTNDAAGDVCSSWSPDGSQIAFKSDRDGIPQIYVMQADGSGQARLAEDAVKHCPVWSPDGSRIAFVSGSELHVVDLESLVVSQLTDFGWDYLAYMNQPDWSPDGEQLAFDWVQYASPVICNISTIYLIKADGTESEPRTLISAGFWPAWSPDGQYIGYNTDYCPAFEPGPSQIAVGGIVLTSQGENFGVTWAPLP